MRALEADPDAADGRRRAICYHHVGERGGPSGRRDGGRAGPRHPTATLAATILGSSVAFIDGSVVNVALPALARDLGAGPAGLAWTINAYLLPLGALILLGGGAGDHYGRRRLFIAGLAAFLLASLVCALAPSLPWLLAGRGLQGLGAAMLMPNSLAILGSAFQGEARGRAIGTWAAAGAIAGALGPLAGGWLVDVAGWRAIFLVNLPVGGAAALLAWHYVDPDDDRPRAVPLDWSGAALVTAALALLTWALTAAAAASATDATAVGIAAALGTALAAAFIVVEWRQGEAALIPPSLFTTSTFAGLTLFTFLLYGALGGLLVLLPFLLIRIEGWSAVAAGAALLPIPVIIGLGSRRMGRFAARIGGRLPLALGAAIVALGLLLYAGIRDGGLDYLANLLVPSLLVAVGLTLCVAPLTTSVLGAVGQAQVGAASGFNSAVARIAGLVATALLSSVLARQGAPDAFRAGFRTAALVGGGLAGLASAGALLLVRRPAKPPG